MTPLIMLTVSVKNPEGECASDLNKNNLEVMDDKQIRPIEIFESENAPLSIGILIDASGSMSEFGPQDKATSKGIVKSVSQFLQLGDPANEYFVMIFDRSPRLISEWASATSLISQGIEFLLSRHHTALYDACFSAFEMFKTARNQRRALILITDAGDNDSRHTGNELREMLRRSNVALHVIVTRLPHEISYFSSSAGLNRIADPAHITGGEVFAVDDLDQMNRAFTLIDNEFHHEYRVGFRANPEQPNKWHHLKIKATLPKDVVKKFGEPIAQTRNGYYAQ